jgi:hypothetical protein
MDTFYATVTTFSFTLLGLWWGVLQIRLPEWLNSPAKRRMAHSVYLALIVPGIMSLGAQIAPDIKIMWRLVFITGSAGGIIATIFMMRAASGDMAHGFFRSAGRWITILLYAFVLLTALFPEPYAAIGFTGLQGEALWLTLLVFLGVMMAWEAVMEPTAPPKG